ncbi:MAG TPA: MaoC family dehydratase N-terminal domain-containing protein [Paenalcaligenes sp.]|nr:MaoC family dehydratase N-terminal domain-containing protein [Paenalcaligenes sp.]
MGDTAQQLGQGYYWQDLQVGQQYKTYRRTITETDIVNFISVTGMLEVIFTDHTYEGAIQGRPVPGSLTYGIIEGLLMQGMVQGTGLALLEVHKKMLAPVVAGDTIWALVTVTHVRETSKGGRAIVDTHVSVRNQNDVEVMSYDVKRMLAGRP